MRVFQVYHFLLGTKRPFSDWPSLAQAFLDRQGLHPQKFCYYFDDLDNSDWYNRILDGRACQTCRSGQDCEACRKEAQRGLDRKTACHRAVKDCPALGPVRTEIPRSGCASAFLTNIDQDTPCSEAQLLSMLPKLYRKYGFNNSYLFYQDVDFFSRRLPSLTRVDRPLAERFVGSGIVLNRWSVDTKWNGITLRIDVLHGAELLDAAPYRDAMAALLPRVRCMEYQETYFSPEEQAELDARNAEAQPLLEQAQAFFKTRFPGSDGPNLGASAVVSLAPTLRKLCRRYGYSYLKYFNNTHLIQKPTPHGHVLVLELDTGVRRQEANLLIYLQGLGFSHRVAYLGYAPRDQADAEAYLARLFEALSEAETAVLPALDALHPPAPAWFRSKAF